MSRRLLLALCAVALAGPVALGVLHLAGARELTGAVAGLVPGVGRALAGALYVAAWFATLLVTPVVVGATLLGLAATRVAERRARPRRAGP